MENQTKQAIANVPTEISEGFWNLKGHYFGDTAFFDDRITFSGNRRSFSLKKVPLTFEVLLNEIENIQFSNSRLVKIGMKNGTKRILMLGQGELNEYGSKTSANMFSGATLGAAGDTLYQIARSKNNEKLMQTVYELLKTNPSYNGLIAGAPTGVTTSSLHRNYLIARFTIPIIFLIIAAFLVVRNFSKY